MELRFTLSSAYPKANAELELLSRKARVERAKYLLELGAAAAQGLQTIPATAAQSTQENNNASEGHVIKQEAQSEDSGEISLNAALLCG